MKFLLGYNDAVELPSDTFPDRVPNNIRGSQSTIARSFNGLAAAHGARTTALGGEQALSSEETEYYKRRADTERELAKASTGAAAAAHAAMAQRYDALAAQYDLGQNLPPLGQVARCP